MNRVNKWRQKQKRIKQTKQLAKRMLAINEHQRIDALNDRHPVQRKDGKEPIK
ncbi:hypothetical protein ACWNS2_13885 [Planococcus plakortidis]